MLEILQEGLLFVEKKSIVVEDDGTIDNNNRDIPINVDEN